MNLELYHGDCLEVMDKLIEQGVKVDAIITDPPYNISRDNNFQTMKDRSGRTGIDFGEWDKEADILPWLKPASELLKENGNLIVFNAWENLGDIKRFATKYGLQVKRPLVFQKSNPAPFNRDRLS